MQKVFDGCCRRRRLCCMRFDVIAGRGLATSALFSSPRRTSAAGGQMGWRHPSPGVLPAGAATAKGGFPAGAGTNRPLCRASAPCRLFPADARAGGLRTIPSDRLERAAAGRHRPCRAEDHGAEPAAATADHRAGYPAVRPGGLGPAARFQRRRVAVSCRPRRISAISSSFWNRWP